MALFIPNRPNDRLGFIAVEAASAFFCLFLKARSTIMMSSGALWLKIFCHDKINAYFCSAFDERLFVFSFARSTKAMVHRDVAQLVAHYVRDVGVACSSHVIPTLFPSSS